MAEKHYTREDLVKKSQSQIINELISMGAPIKILRESITDVSNYGDNELEIGEGFEAHSDIRGGVTYLWNFWD